MKPKHIHLDKLGREITVGTCVAVAHRNSLSIAVVDKLHPKMVKVKIVDAVTDNWYRGLYNKHDKASITCSMLKEFIELEHHSILIDQHKILNIRCTLWDKISDIEIANELLTFHGYKNRKFAYISDTIYDETIVPNISDVTLLYHEATFLHDRLQRAQETFHTTALQAGQIAKLANAKNLMIGHYSARYLDLEPLLLEAKKIHLETYLAIEGEVFQLNS
jgi:ribonuclease BN (tRNA processing enzyme)